MKRRQWLKNDFDPALVQSANFAVEESPVQLVATGLALTETIGIEVRADATTTRASGVDHYWAPLYRNGCRVELRGDNNQIVILVPGVYRLAPTAYAGPVTVALWEDETPNGDRIQFVDISNKCASESTPFCSSPPLAGQQYVSVQRCDASGNAVTLIYSIDEPNNAVCPPVPGGAMTLIGYIDGSGLFTAGAYPGTLQACGCAPKVPLGELTSW